ncbi:response regulator [Erythrobacteraceae bacterium WH01K]|nr:response regulator [Erythrobacteraceae bacterium WH01K]
MSGPAKYSSPGHVLVVEDDALLALSIETTLEDAGAKSVTVVSSTAQALDALRRHKPDVIILDVHLADRHDGWAIAELVDTIGPNPPRIIFSTGSPEDIPPAIAEMGAVLTKPYAPEQLLGLAAGEETAKRKKAGLLSRLRR